MNGIKKVSLLGCIGFFVSMGLIVVDGLFDESQKADVIVVLGNKVEKNGEVSVRLQSRLDKAIELFLAAKANTIIVSGGVGDEGFDEAQVMASYLTEKGIPASAIIQDNKGYSTYDTAMQAKSIMAAHEWGSSIVVSQYFHISRTKLAFKKFGISEVRGVHADIHLGIRDAYSLPREVIGYISYLHREYVPI